MAEEENQFIDWNAKASEEKEKRKKIKKKKILVKEDFDSEEEDQIHRIDTQEEGGKKSKKRKGEKRGSKEKRMQLLNESAENKEENGLDRNVENQSKEAVLAIDDVFAEGKKKNMGKADESSEGKEVSGTGAAEEKNLQYNDEKAERRKIKRKKRLLKEAAAAKNRGICYLSRVPPHMDPFKLRQLLSQYGEIQRIYLIPETKSASQVNRKRAGRFKEQGFSEGWVEFSDKRIAKRVADMLNGEQIGGRKRSSFYYDLWNIKYLSKFKWDDLTAETAQNNASREQKLTLELAAAKRERDFYLSKVDKARALSSIEERLKKKQKLQEEEGTSADPPVSQQAPKVIRKFPQKQPVTDTTAVSKPRLSKDILAGVFGGS